MMSCSQNDLGKPSDSDTQTIYQVCSVASISGVLSQRGREKQQPPSLTDLHDCMAPWPSLMGFRFVMEKQASQHKHLLTDRMVQKCWRKYEGEKCKFLKAETPAGQESPRGPAPGRMPPRLASPDSVIVNRVFSPLQKLTGISNS